MMLIFIGSNHICGVKNWSLLSIFRRRSSVFWDTQNHILSMVARSLIGITVICILPTSMAIVYPLFKLKRVLPSSSSTYGFWKKTLIGSKLTTLLLVFVSLGLVLAFKVLTIRNEEMLFDDRERGAVLAYNFALRKLRLICKFEKKLFLTDFEFISFVPSFASLKNCPSMICLDDIRVWLWFFVSTFSLSPFLYNM